MAKKQEIEETKVQKKVTRKSNATKKPKKIEVIDEIVDIEETEEDLVEVTPKKTYRELVKELRDKKNKIDVEILNLNTCRTSCKDSNGRSIFKLEKTGSREFISLADAYDVAHKYKGFFEKHLIAIIDIDTDEYTIEEILTYLNLDEIYSNNEIENYDTDYIAQILKLDGKKFEEVIESANNELVRIVAARAVELYRQGKFDSRIKERVLVEKMGKEELFEI